MHASIVSLLAGSLLCAASLAQSKPLYTNSFEQAEIGKVPADMLVLDGGFAVQEEGNNKFLELPGAPLDSFAVVFGPSEKEDVSVSARIRGTGKGRRFPTFGVGLNGAGGYKLQVSPGKKLLELYRGEEPKGSATFNWESDKWTRLRLRLRKTRDTEWVIEGRAWIEGAPEPPDWMLAVQEKEEPRAGRASLFGSPFAGTPIRFDDLTVERVGGK